MEPTGTRRAPTDLNAELHRLPLGVSAGVLGKVKNIGGSDHAAPLIAARNGTACRSNFANLSFAPTRPTLIMPPSRLKTSQARSLRPADKKHFAVYIALSLSPLLQPLVAPWLPRSEPRR